MNRYYRKRNNRSFETEFIENLLMKPRFVRVNNDFIKQLGCISACYLSILLQKFLYFVEQKYISSSDKFYTTEYFIESKHGISSEMQRKLDRKLQKLKLLDVKISGNRKYFKLNLPNIRKLLNYDDDEEI